MNALANVLEVEHVVYPKTKDCKFTAVAVTRIELPTSEPRATEICIFSQELLTNCESIGTIVYSDTKTQGPLKWKYLCNSTDDSLKNIHLFDLEYLKPYLDFKKADYVHCPLCKSGITEFKEAIEEHDISSMEQLKEKRDSAKGENDLPMVLFHEKLMVEKACQEKWDPSVNQSRIKLNEDILEQTLQHWKKQQKIVEFRPAILSSLRKAIEKENHRILKIVMRHCNIPKPDLVELLNYATQNAAFDCTNVILEVKELPIENRPQCLSNSINAMNCDLIDKVIAYLIILKRVFVGDDCFKECIKKDLVGVAKKLLELRWHKPLDSDYEFAEKLDGLVWSWLSARANAVAQVGLAVNDDGTTLDWDDWEAEEEANDETMAGGDDGWD